MSSSYSMWPMFLIPYNFPPWECGEQSNFIMGLLIPGRECPGKDIDVFLEPLVEEFLELWKGVPTVDALSEKKFDLHAAVIWCIHDYPTLSTCQVESQEVIMLVCIVTKTLSPKG